MIKVALIGQAKSSFSLADSYLRSLVNTSNEVKQFNVMQYLPSYIKFGKIGLKLYNHIKVINWERQANRDLAIALKEYRPDVIIIMGKTHILPGTIAFLKSIMPVKVVVIWMDTLCNLNDDTIRISRLTDLCASYSLEAIPVLKRLGFENVQWIPLAGDKYFHGIDTAPEEFVNDLCFIGGWRPERETTMLTIIENFPNVKLKIYGYYWNKSKNYNTLKPFLNNISITGKEYAKILNTSRINLNIIDDTNYPSANMRFFEIPIANGLQLSSSCPEQSEIFKDGEHQFYFDSQKELVEKIQYIFDNEEKAKTIRQNGNALALNSQTYDHRLNNILNYVESK